MNILLISTQDYIHHPVPSRHHNIFERLAEKHLVVVPHFHVSRESARKTKTIIEESTMFPFTSPIVHYSANFPHQYATFNRIITQYDIDVVVASNVLAGTAAIRAAKIHNVPVLFDIKDWFPVSATQYNKNKLLKKIIYESVLFLTLRNLRRSDVVTTVSPGLQKKLAEYGIMSHVIQNGVDTSLFRPMDGGLRYRFHDQLGIRDDDFVIGFVGSVERWYELDKVITAFSAVGGRAKLIIVGPSLFTDYRQQLDKQVRRMNLDGRVVFTGGVPYNALPQYINMFDVGIMPLGTQEWNSYALPNKYFEYSACGKPIISSEMTDVRNLNKEHVFFYHDWNEFVDLIQKIRSEKPIFKINAEEYDWYKRSETFEKMMLSTVRHI